jgi:hypothetical protein
VLCEAHQLPFPRNSVSVVVSSLGDAYNDLEFWKNLSEIVAPHGHVIYTTPSYDWAYEFRNPNDPEDMRTAEFELEDGRTVKVPSIVLRQEEQTAVVEECGFQVADVEQFPLSRLRAKPVSEKLVSTRGSRVSIVTGYRLLKR